MARRLVLGNALMYERFFFGEGGKSLVLVSAFLLRRAYPNFYGEKGCTKGSQRSRYFLGGETLQQGIPLGLRLLSAVIVPLFLPCGGVWRSLFFPFWLPYCTHAHRRRLCDSVP